MTINITSDMILMYCKVLSSGMVRSRTPAVGKNQLYLLQPRGTWDGMITSQLDNCITPPTTPHGRFENAFPVWRENFPRSFKFDVEVDPPVPTFGGNLGYY